MIARNILCMSAAALLLCATFGVHSQPPATRYTTPDYLPPDMQKLPIALGMRIETATQHALDPGAVAAGKELPRSGLIPYPSAREALAQQYGESTYLQPLDGKWNSAPLSQSGQEGTIFNCTFKFPFAWIDRQFFLRVESVTSSYEVRMNGKSIGYSQDGRTPAEYDLTAHAVEDNNTLELLVYANGAARKIEESAQAGESPAITGRTFIIAQPRVRVRDFIAETRMDGDNGLFSLGIIMKSHLLNAKEYEIFYELLSPTGKVIANSHRKARFEMQSEDTVRFFANIPTVQPWNEETPHLYTLQIRTKHEGRFGEYFAIPVGFRHITMEKGQVLLNGRPIEFRAMEFTAPNNAKAIRAQLAALKKSGANAIRIAGYPAQPDLYRICDELGIYVCNQANINTSRGGVSITRGGNPSNDPAWRDAYVERALAMYHTSKNHPSVILFSIAENAANGFCLYESYLALKKVEKLRPVIYLGAGGQWNSDAAATISESHGRILFMPAAEGSLFQIPERVELSRDNAGKTLFVVTNRYIYTTLRNAEVAYTIRSGSRNLAGGKIAFNAEPGQSVSITLPISAKIRHGSPVEITLTVSHDSLLFGSDSGPALTQRIQLAEKRFSVVF